MTDYSDVETIYEPHITLKTITYHVKEGRQAGPFPAVTSPAECIDIARAIFATLDDDQEHVVMLVMTTAGTITGYKIVASGGMSEAIVDAKVVFRCAILLGAAQFVLLHNHPSGNLEPSREDVAITKSLIATGKLVGLPLTDHIILTATGHYSLAERSYAHDLYF